MYVALVGAFHPTCLLAYLQRLFLPGIDVDICVGCSNAQVQMFSTYPGCLLGVPGVLGMLDVLYAVWHSRCTDHALHRYVGPVHEGHWVHKR